MKPNLFLYIKLYSIGLHFWIDVCPTDANLLAVGGPDGSIKIFDRRESNIVKTFQLINARKICLNVNDSIHLTQHI